MGIEMKKLGAFTAAAALAATVLVGIPGPARAESCTGRGPIEQLACLHGSDVGAMRCSAAAIYAWQDGADGRITQHERNRIRSSVRDCELANNGFKLGGSNITAKHRTVPRTYERGQVKKCTSAVKKADKLLHRKHVSKKAMRAWKKTMKRCTQEVK